MANGIKLGNLTIDSFKVGSSDCKIYLGDTLLYPPQTPSYTLLDGIERKEGYLGHVDLGLGVGTDFKIEFTIMYKTAAGGYLIGVDNSFRWFKASNSVYFDYNGQRISRTAGTYYPNNTKITVTLTNYKFVSNLGGQKTGTTQSSYTSSKNLALFTSNITNNGDLGVFYGVKVYTNDGNTLVGDFIPVRRNYDNVVTMYNTVTNTFCSVNGTLYGVEIS